MACAVPPKGFYKEDNKRKIAGFPRPISYRNYPNKYNQHTANLWAEILDAQVCFGQEYNDGDEVYFHLGADYSGAEQFNLFGGLTEGLYIQCKAWVETDAKFYSLIYDMPDIGATVMKRLHNKSTYHLFNEEFAKKLSKKCKEIITVSPLDFAKNGIIYGDSHVLSMADVKQPFVKIMAKTLFGTLKENKLQEYAKEAIEAKAPKITFMFGSVDLRHHLCRRDDVSLAVKTLANEYFRQVELISKMGILVEICSPVPVEFEGRKIAKTGYYKGTTFYGSRDKRLKATLEFIHILEKLTEKSEVRLVTYPKEWYDMDGEIFAETIMEKPNNSHISSNFSRFNSFRLPSVNHFMI